MRSISTKLPTFTQISPRAIALPIIATMLSMTSPLALAAGAFDDALAFDAAAYTPVNVTVDGTEITVRRYETVYVGKPIEMAPTQPPRGVGPGGGEPSPDRRPLEDPFAYQTMHVYVPESAVEDDDTAIVLHVHNGGWFASGAGEAVAEGEAHLSTSDDDEIGAALAAGYVIVDIGTRSRGAESVDGLFAGKAPSAVVDAKAAIRYLRLNDAAMPGSAERIVISGTSGGGALSTAVAASGNSADYHPYLAEIGAAGISADGMSSLNDDVFATIAYCPITDLGNADIAYEWQFQGIRSADNTSGGDYSAVAQDAAGLLASRYPAYLGSLGLTLPDGTPLTAETMVDAIVHEVVRETEEHLAQGGTVPAIGEMFELTNRGQTTQLENDWLTVQDGKVVSVDYDKYLNFVTKASSLKIVPAFDATANTDHPHLRGENSLFGPYENEYANFTEYGWNNNQVEGDGSGADDTGLNWADYIAAADTVLDDQIRMVNPLAYLDTEADSAPYWYLRHGMVDRDTSFAVELALYHAVQNDPNVKDVNFELAWMRPHSGNYDVQEAYAWLAEKLAEAGTP